MNPRIAEEIAMLTKKKKIKFSIGKFHIQIFKILSDPKNHALQLSANGSEIDWNTMPITDIRITILMLVFKNR